MAEIFDSEDIDFDRYMHATEAKQRVKSAAIYVQALIDRANDPSPPRHHLMPWGKTAGILQFRPGEVTVWGGENGSGKSLITGQVALSLCAQDSRVAIASFEMKPIKTLERMGRQWTHHSLNDREIMSDPTERRALLERYGDFRDWSDGKLWLYDQQGTVQWRQVCAVARYAAQELRIQHFFVDNLAKCVKGEDDYNGQKEFVDELCAIARDEDIHIHLVHHLKKPSSPNAKPTKADYKGSGSITDQPDNTIAVWRNKVKERSSIRSADAADTVLIVDKQRNGEGWEGEIALWFLPHSQQFVAGANEEPMEFINAPGYDAAHPAHARAHAFAEATS